MAPTAIVFVNTFLFDEFHKRRKEIDRRYPAFDWPADGSSVSEHWQNLADLRAAAKAEIRQAMRIAARDCVFGPDEWRYAIAV